MPANEATPATALIQFDTPYRVPRSPVFARNMVSSSQPLATQAGVTILQRGGNAIDAALATAITLTVVEPCMNGVGSDAFAQVWDGQALHGLNASGCSPAGWDRSRFAKREKMPGLGWDSITVPGAVSAWATLSERFGQIPFEDLFEPAIRYARDGFAVGPHSAAVWQEATAVYSRFEEFSRHFLPAPATGQRVVRPELVGTLEDIAATRGDSFYHGRLAEEIHSAAQSAGAALTREDLAAHTPLWVDPIQQTYGDATLCEIPPNGQGLAAQIALAILAHLPQHEIDSPAWMHYQIEAMKIAIRAAFDHFADPSAMQLSPGDLLGSGVIERAAAQITDQATQLPPKALPGSQDTVYLCAADAQGRMVSFIQSNYMSFGSGIVIPGTGIAMQNRGSGFTLESGHPNEVGPAKRPFHTIIPGFALWRGEPSLAFGVMGGHMQAQGHVQMMTRIFDHQQNPQTASDAPRWIVNEDFSVGLEDGVPESVLRDLQQRGHNADYDRRLGTFGGAQLIMKQADGYVSGSDHRKEGCAAGY